MPLPQLNSIEIYLESIGCRDQVALNAWQEIDNTIRAIPPEEDAEGALSRHLHAELKKILRMKRFDEPLELPVAGEGCLDKVGWNVNVEREYPWPICKTVLILIIHEAIRGLDANAIINSDERSNVSKAQGRANLALIKDIERNCKTAIIFRAQIPSYNKKFAFGLLSFLSAVMTAGVSFSYILVTLGNSEKPSSGSYISLSVGLAIAVVLCCLNNPKQDPNGQLKRKAAQLESNMKALLIELTQKPVRDSTLIVGPHWVVDFPVVKVPPEVRLERRIQPLVPVDQRAFKCEICWGSNDFPINIPSLDPEVLAVLSRMQEHKEDVLNPIGTSDTETKYATVIKKVENGSADSKEAQQSTESKRTPLAKRRQSLPTKLPGKDPAAIRVYLRLTGELGDYHGWFHFTCLEQAYTASRRIESPLGGEVEASPLGGFLCYRAPRVLFPVAQCKTVEDKVANTATNVQSSTNQESKRSENLADSKASTEDKDAVKPQSKLQRRHSWPLFCKDSGPQDKTLLKKSEENSEHVIDIRSNLALVQS